MDSKEALLSLFFIGCKQSCPSLRGRHYLSLPMKSTIQNPWEESPEQRQSVILLVRCAEVQETHGGWSPNTMLMEAPPPCNLSSLARAAITNYHRLGGLNYNSLPHSSSGSKSTIKM